MATTHSQTPFSWNDPFLLNDQLSEEERMIRESAEAFAEAELAPRVHDAYLEEKTDPGLFKLMG
ncbi:acyl-CoA dehydrogenase family protein, partial [Rhizobium sp. BR 362]|uniref:acyl-CoA dehydrogenase family protein n=1 Tax=Rhizobium sp. BR 362 TaxID=3040670 RepID=UPI002F41454C